MKGKLDIEQLAQDIMDTIVEHLDDSEIAFNVQILNNHTIEILDGDTVVVRWKYEWVEGTGECDAV